MLNVNEYFWETILWIKLRINTFCPLRRITLKIDASIAEYTKLFIDFIECKSSINWFDKPSVCSCS